jgi:hypothetical protein
MRFARRVFWLKAILLITVAAVAAQTAAESAPERLRAQLRETEAQETALQERARQLDEELKPENIERSLALTGSTRPEELREQRRKELEREKEKVRAQLEQLAASRTRLQAAISTADAEAYRQSASPASPAPPTERLEGSTVSIPAAQPSRPAARQRRRSARRPRQQQQRRRRRT